MAVTLIKAPQPYSFSGNFIPVQIQSSTYLQTAPSYAVNEITFIDFRYTSQVDIRWGSNRVQMWSYEEPGVDGNYFPLGDGSPAYVASILPYFQSNYELSRDFDITASGNKLVFTAKKADYGYEFTNFSYDYYAIGSVWPGSPQAVKPNYCVFFWLYLENENHTGYDLIYETRLPIRFGTDGICEADISAYLHDKLQASGYDLPGFSSIAPFPCKKTCRKYYFRYAEAFGDTIKVQKVNTSPVYTVVLGKLSYVGAIEKSISGLLQPDGADITQDRFLRQSPAFQKVLATQPQFLYFFNTRTTAAGAKLKVKWYFHDQTTAIETISIFDLEQHRKYAFNVRFDMLFNQETHPGKSVASYDVYLDNSADLRISEIRTFEVDYGVKLYVRYFLFLSSWGAMDSLLCYGKGSISYDYKHEEVSRIRKPGYSLSDGDFAVFDVKTQDKFKVASGWMSYQELVLTRDFILSPKKFRYTKGRLFPITLTSKTIEELDDKEHKYKQQYEYKYLFEDDAFTERNEDESEVITEKPKLLNVYFGPSGSKPVTAADVKALQSQPETIYEFTLNTGAARIFTVAVPHWKSLHNVYDPLSEEDLTLQYKHTVISIDGENYKVYTMEMAIGYSIPHEHLIILKNG